MSTDLAGIVGKCGRSLYHSAVLQFYYGSLYKGILIL